MDRGSSKLRGGYNGLLKNGGARARAKLVSLTDRNVDAIKDHCVCVMLSRRYVATIL